MNVPSFEPRMPLFDPGSNAFLSTEASLEQLPQYHLPPDSWLCSSASDESKSLPQPAHVTPLELWWKFSEQESSPWSTSSRSMSPSSPRKCPTSTTDQIAPHGP